MLNLLVTIDRSLEASFALRTACLFGAAVSIQPIYVFDPPGRDIAFGAGWARKSWERESSRQAEKNIGDLVLAERSQCPSIHDPVVLTGDPIQAPVDYFWDGNFDLLVVGAPFRGLGPLALCRRFGHAAHKEHRDLPLLVVRHLKNMEKIVALTDGSDMAENTLGLLLKINSFISGKITLVGAAGAGSKAASSEALNLERGLAIMNEKGIQASGHSASELGAERLQALLKQADLLVNPVHHQDPLHFTNDLQEDDIQAVLLYLGARAKL
jgi:nucleotide-binding universal stress UspA family protein